MKCDESAMQRCTEHSNSAISDIVSVINVWGRGRKRESHGIARRGD